MEEEESSVLKIVYIHKYKDLKTTLKWAKETNYSDQKLHWENKDKQNDGNKETEMGRKTTVLVFQVINWRNITRGNLDMDYKGKP